MNAPLTLDDFHRLCDYLASEEGREKWGLPDLTIHGVEMEGGGLVFKVNGKKATRCLNYYSWARLDNTGMFIADWEIEDSFVKRNLKIGPFNPPGGDPLPEIAEMQSMLAELSAS